MTPGLGVVDRGARVGRVGRIGSAGAGRTDPGCNRAAGCSSHQSLRIDRVADHAVGHTLGRIAG